MRKTFFTCMVFCLLFLYGNTILAQKPIPFTEGFEDGSLQSYWTTGGSVSPAVQSNNVYKGGHALCFNTPSGDNNYMEIELAAETDPMLTFSYYLDYAYNLDLSVDIYTNGTWTDNIWEDNDSYDEDVKWMQAEIDLSSYNTESGSFKLRFNSSSGEYTDEDDFIYLDEVIVGGPSNPAPNNELVNISSGDLSWDHGLNVSTYDVKFGEAGNMTTVSSNNSISGTSANYTYSDLDYRTFYQWQIIYYKEDNTQIDGPVWSFYTKFSGTEEGTEADPFIIDSEDDLLTLSLHPEYWGDNYKQEANIEFNSNENLVDWDGDGSADWDTEDQKGFSPIGNEGTSFMGSYDGNSHTISGLYINRPSTDYVGLFGNIGFASGPQIINLGLLNIDITGNDKVGALIGYKNGYTVNNCYALSGSVSGNDEVGGLIGYCGYADMERCYTNCNVSGNSSIGGLIGNTYTAGPEFIKQSYSLGDVSGTSKVGGLIGNNYMIGYQNCYSRGNVTRTSGSEINFGGFIGINSAGSDILYSYSTGAVYSSPGNIWGDNDGLTDDKGFLGEEDNPGGHYTFNYTANFFDSDASNQSTDAVGSATPKTTDKMTNATTTNNIYLDAGWDFVGESNNGSDDIWNIGNDRNDGYPYLVWENPEDDASLPIELANFTATSSDDQITLRWVTESETDNLGFNVYRSLNKNEHYRKINGGLIEGAGNSSQKHKYTFVDNNVVKGFTYWYKLEDVDYEGQGTMHGPISPQESKQEQAPQFRLSPAYPNPFNPVTNIAYEIPKDGNVKLLVYNLEGKVVKTLVNCEKSAGEYELEWNGTNQSGNLVSSGLYFVTIASGNYKKTNKIIFVR